MLRRRLDGQTCLVCSTDIAISDGTFGGFVLARAQDAFEVESAIPPALGLGEGGANVDGRITCHHFRLLGDATPRC